MRKTVCGLVMTALLVVAGRSAAADKPVAFRDVPAAVRDAAKKVTTDVTWTSATKHQDGDQVLYLLHGTNANKRDITVISAPDGDDPVVATIIPLTEVPADVTKALHNKRLFKEKSVQTFGHNDREVIAYQFKGETIGGVPQMIYVYAKTLRVEVEEIELNK